MQDNSKILQSETAVSGLSRFEFGIVESIACLIIVLTASLMIASSWDDSQNWDEGEHLTSGYLCLAKQNFQVNCWHPPLMKDIAAVPLLFMNVKAPPVRPGLLKGNFTLPGKFLYKIGNDAQSLLRAGRVSLILVVAGFYAYFFFTVRRFFGRPAALLGLTLLCCSPTFLAHGRYITNDVLAAAAFFICISEFVAYLYSQNDKRLLWVGLVTGAAQLVKFSLVLLYPLYAVYAVIFLFRNGFTLSKLLASLTRVAIIAGISLTVVATVYCHHTWNQPPSFQQKYNQRIFAIQFKRTAPLLVSATQDVPLLRGFSWYMTGLSAQSMRMCTRPPAQDKFFIGQAVKAIQSWSYFPILIVTKEPIGFLGLLILAAGSFFAASVSPKFQNEKSTDSSEKNATSEAAMLLLGCSLLFIWIYLTIAMAGKLTIGIRHLAPVFPFVYMVGSVALVQAITAAKERSRCLLISVVFVLLSWGCLSSLSSFPGFLAYFNEFAGGKTGGANIVNDSNYDWGTDLLRLRQYMDNNNISQIYLRYVGTANPKYYLGERFKYLDYRTLPPPGSLVAISVRHKQIEMLTVNEEFHDGPPGGGNVAKHKWLSSLIPVGKAGDSILIYRTQ